MFRRLTRFIFLALVGCTVIGMHSVQAQMNHDASWATRSGWEANPARLHQQKGSPMIYLDAAYSGSKAIGFQQLMWKADASKANAVGSARQTMTLNVVTAAPRRAQVKFQILKILEGFVPNI